MEGAVLQLVEGHIHQDWTRDFSCLVEVWPTPRAGFWHVWLRGPQSYLTKEPLPSDLIPELLEDWGFSAEEWRNWRVDAPPTHPGLPQSPVSSPPPGPKGKPGHTCLGGR